MRVFLPLLFAMLLASCTSENPTTSQTGAKAVDTAVHAPIPAHFTTEQEAKPLPATMSPALFADPKIAKVYEIAERIPAVLAQQPCYCYCDRGHGHRSLLDCQRDNHSAGCTVCRKEVLLADRMTRMGLSAKEIRSAIIRGDWKEVAE